MLITCFFTKNFPYFLHYSELHIVCEIPSYISYFREIKNFANVSVGQCLSQVRVSQVVTAPIACNFIEVWNLKKRFTDAAKFFR